MGCTDSGTQSQGGPAGGWDEERDAGRPRQQTLQTQALSADAALPLAVIECDKSLPCERPQRPTLMSALSPA